MNKSKVEKGKLDYCTEIFLKDLNFNSFDKEMCNDLIKEYMDGNHSVRKDIIMANLGLIISRAKKSLNKVKKLTLLDLIQEGAVALLSALDKYDMTIGAFSTFAVPVIDNALANAIAFQDNLIRKPVYLTTISRKYLKLLQDYYEETKEYPSDEYIKEALNITDYILDFLKNEQKLNECSLDAPVLFDQEEVYSLGDCISYPEDDFEEIIEQENFRELLLVIKNILNPKEYYVLYYRLVHQPTKTLSSIAKIWGVKEEAVRQIEERAKSKICNYVKVYSKGYIFKLGEIKKKHGVMFNRQKTFPILPDDIYALLYLKDKMDMKNLELLFLLTIDNYNYSLKEIELILGMDKEEFNNMYVEFKKRVRNEINSNGFKEFKDQLKKQYSSKIYNVYPIKNIIGLLSHDESEFPLFSRNNTNIITIGKNRLKVVEKIISDKEEDIDYIYINKKYFPLNWERIMKIFGNKLNDLSEEEYFALYDFYENEFETNVDIDRVYSILNSLDKKLKFKVDKKYTKSLTAKN